MSTSLSAAIGVLGGSYSFDASALGEYDTVQREFEQLTTTMYMVTQRRLDYGINLALPGMAAQLQADGDFANLYGIVKPEYDRAVVGASNAAAIAIGNAARQLLASLNPAQRYVYLEVVEKLVMEAATEVTAAMALTMGVAYEQYREGRDAALSYLFKDIEVATKLRTAGDSMQRTGMASAFSALKDRLDELSHNAAMRHIKWDRDRRVKQLNNPARDYAAFAGMAVSGIVDGYQESKAAAASTAKGV